MQRPGLETIPAVRLAEEHAAAQFRGRQARRRGQPVGSQDLRQRRAGVIVVPSVAPEHGGNRGAEVRAAAPRIQPAVLVIRLDDLGGAATGKITGEEQRGMFRIGAVLRVQPHVSHRVVGASIAVEVRRRDRPPPARPRRGEARLLRPVLELLPAGVVEILHLAPFERQQQVRPAVTVDVAPECRRDHADVAQHRCHGIGDVHEFSPAVRQQHALLAPPGKVRARPALR